MYYSGSRKYSNICHEKFVSAHYAYYIKYSEIGIITVSTIILVKFESNVEMYPSRSSTI